LPGKDFLLRCRLDVLEIIRMPPRQTPADTFLRIPMWFWGLAVSASGGAICAWLKTPLPWMIGPLLGMAIFNFSGAKLESPFLARESGQFLIAIALGLYFTPPVAREVGAHWALLLGAAFAAMLIGHVAGRVLSKLSGVDHATGYFASIPGGASEMANLGERFGAAVDKVAVAHSLRILLVVCTVPVALTLIGVQGTDDYRPVVVPLDWLKLFMLFGVVGAFGILFQLIRFPNPWMMGPLVGTIVITTGGMELSSMPTWLTNAGQVLLGVSLGARFQKSFLKDAPRFVASIVATIYLTMLLALLMGIALTYLSNVPMQTLILATAPGGIAEMSITAKVLKLGVALVTAAHVTRVLVIVSFTLPVYKLMMKRNGRKN
jgi:uncharacterized protein